ncbi:MAG: M6 family metalloprotease domain-containing protein [Muribaculaceae bacterium]|nr:M6 family metalloprotease domain-containing protein [Muribaculaceae bacterium]
MRKTIIPFLTASLLVGSAFEADAVKSWPGLLKGKTTSGEEITYTVRGDEFAHAMVSEDGFLLTATEFGLKKEAPFSAEALRAQADRIKKLPRNTPKRLIDSQFPTTGSLQGIILLVEFADNEFHEGHDAAFFHDKMNAPGFSGLGATGSARDYFVDQSSGLFTPDFDVAGPIKLSHNMNYYGANDRNGQDSHPAKMVKEACEAAAEEYDIDFSKYDYDNDGFVDFVYVIYAGYAESYGASSNTIWPHASQLTLHGESCNLNDKTVDRYACSSELKYVSGDTPEGIGTFCHEFSHVLGLPDVYDTRNAQNIQLGSWDVMDQGNYNNESHTPPSFSAMQRASLGWLELVELDTPADRIEVYELNSSNTAYRISTPVEGEYFTLENRQQQGWDRYQPGRGLMIMHIAYDESAWYGNFVNSGIVRRYDLVEADGTQGSSPETDLFPYGDVNAFTDYTSPSSLTWDGIATCKGVTMITQEDDCISFRFMKDRFAAPENVTVTERGNDWFTASWSPVEEAGLYSLAIREVLSDEVNPVLVAEDFDNLTEGKYPNADYNDISGSLDDYLLSEGWSGSLLFQTGGRIQLGRYGEDGSLLLPAVSLPAGVNSATVALRVVSYPGKSVNFTVEILDASTYTPVATLTEKANKTEKDVIWTPTDLPSSFIVRVSTANERLFIDSLRLLKGGVAEEDIWNIGARSWTINEITETFCRVEDLVPGMNYAFTVTTEAFNGWYTSEPSQEYIVSLSESLVPALSTSTVIVKSIIYDLTGCPVSSAHRGLHIVVTDYSDGTRTVEKRID